MSTESNEALLSCPFCGSSAKHGNDPGNEVYGQTFWIVCKAHGCGAESPKFWGSSTWNQNGKKQDAEAKQKAVKWWNRRP